HDTLELLRIPTIVETIARSGPRRRPLLADNLCGDAGGLTDLACCEIAPDTGQHDRLSISVLRGLHLAVRGLHHDPVRNSALRAEAANLLEVHVVQFLEEPRALGRGELRQEVRLTQEYPSTRPARGASAAPRLRSRGCRRS